MGKSITFRSAFAAAGYPSDLAPARNDIATTPRDPAARQKYRQHFHAEDVRAKAAILSAPIFCLFLASCGGGGSDSATAPVQASPLTERSASLVSDCTGANCGAVNASTYSGTGVGIWRYNNTADSAAAINVNIAGVSAGKVATLIYSNSSQATVAAPNPGVLASPVTASPDPAKPDIGSSAAAKRQNQDIAHAQMFKKNQAISMDLIRSLSETTIAADLLSTSPPTTMSLSFAPAVNTSKTWIDNFPATPVTYSTTMQFACPLPSGRNVAWWVDPTIVSSGKFSAAAWSMALNAIQTSYCGSAGGLARINALLGDVWGSAASRYATLIQDGPNSMQDINVVLLNVPANTGWAGYFFNGNNLLKTSFANSNEALVFFINANQIEDDLNIATSTLMHESTHMVNFYQRTVAREVSHDTWLEETSAMMTEDIVTPAVTSGYDKVMSNLLPIYLGTGGNISYINWPTLSSAVPNYALGSGFGAFLNRRYGLSIYQQLVTSCNDRTPATPALTSYACLDGLIKANGGTGFNDEFARFGATVFSQLPGAGSPAGYGYPGTVASASTLSYALQAKDLSTSTIVSPAPLTSGYAATSHTYQRDIIGAGQTSYVRNGVLVPANTTLIVTIK